MDFIDWVGHVFRILTLARQSSLEVRSGGLIYSQIAELVFNEKTINPLAFYDSSYEDRRSESIVEAIGSLSSIGLITAQGINNSRWLISNVNSKEQEVFLPIWRAICDITLEEDTEALLRLVNEMSPQTEDGKDCVWLQVLKGEQLLATLQWPKGYSQLYAAALDLKRLGFASVQTFFSQQLNISATYRGLVWEKRRDLTIETAELDVLIAEWETTSVDFKRELYTDTKDQKAELIKDLLGLANTQASGRRWMIIGFDDKTRSYYGPPDAKISSNHLEQLIAANIEPNLQVRYQTIDYKALGLVGKIEVLRDSRQLPYKVSRELRGDKKRIQNGQVFVRHGSQTEEPTTVELRSLIEEAARANSLPMP